MLGTSFIACYLFFNIGSLIEHGTSFYVGFLASKSLGSTSLPPNLPLQMHTSVLGFFVGAEYLNAGLLTEPSS